MTKTHYDVAIIGGGPAGTTVGSMLLKYDPSLSVAIFEREKFPRDHVGESQLPVISQVLNEMGVWDDIEAANFPVKVGATYRWGQTKELWDFEFLDHGVFRDEPRPAKYQGQRLNTAFQVDRSIYDQILLNHSAKLGCEVFEDTRVLQVEKDPANADRVSNLRICGPDGIERTVTADYYVDGTGHAGLLRRTMGVHTDCPTHLQNIAIWDYWQNADWAVEIGVGGTRIQIMSLDYGWLWFIPLSPTRTSIGLVIPVEAYKRRSLKPDELYEEAIRAEPRISSLLKNATSEGRLATTKDWSFLADRLAGENWFLVGESAGFADPILSAGMSLAHTGGRDAAFTILELRRGNHDPAWLRERYSESNRRQIANHIRFADFWYTSNGVFGDLKDFTKTLAGDAGLELNSEEAWCWFGRGGFIDYDTAAIDVAGYSFLAGKNITANFLGEQPKFEICGKTHFKINLAGAQTKWGATLANGRITRHRRYERDGKSVPELGMCGWLIGLLAHECTYSEIVKSAAVYAAAERIPPDQYTKFQRQFVETMEALYIDGWLLMRTVPGAPAMPQFTVDYLKFMHPNHDSAPDLATDRVEVSGSASR